MHESMVLPQPVFDVQRAAERASFDFGWLRTNHSFSFADYYDPHNVNWGALRVLNDDRVSEFESAVQLEDEARGFVHRNFDAKRTGDGSVRALEILPAT